MRPVTLVVPYAAGGPNDSQARILAARLGELLHQQFIIENVGGAGGMTGANRVAKAAPDGYTLLLAGLAVLGQIPTLYKKPLYNAVTDFEPVALIAESARILITRKDLPADHARRNSSPMRRPTRITCNTPPPAPAPGRMSAPSCSTADRHPHRPCSLSRHRARHAGPGRRPGRLHLRADFDGLSTDQGRPMKALATLASERQPMLADLPTAQEQGVDLDCSVWIALAFPKGTAGAIVDRLAEAANEAVETPACASASRTSASRWSRRSGARRNISPASSRARSRNGPDRSRRAGFMPIEFVAPIHVRHGNCRLIPGRCRPPGESM